MSERNKCIQAIILSISPQGENNRNVCILSNDIGIFHATLYGGPKSKMRSLIQPFNIGKLWIYKDESKKSIKITDFEVTDCHATLYANLYKIWAANLACEIVLKTHCAGDENKVFALLCAFIKGIDICDEKEARLGTIRFLWRYLGILGVQPEIMHCNQCKGSLLSNDSYYISSLHGFICKDCGQSVSLSQEKHFYFPLRKNAVIYLASINELSPGKVRSLAIDSESVYELKQFTFFLIENAVGSKLKSIETGMGIL